MSDWNISPIDFQRPEDFSPLSDPCPSEQSTPSSYRAEQNRSSYSESTQSQENVVEREADCAPSKVEVCSVLVRT